MKRIATVALVALVPLISACGGSPSDEDQIKDAVDQISTAKKADELATVCDDLFTPAFLKEVYGGKRANCVKKPFSDEKEFDDPGETTVASVKVTDPNASVKIETVGGDTDGIDGTWTMKKVDDQWQLDHLEDDYVRSTFAAAVKKVDTGMVAFGPMRKCFLSKVDKLDQQSLRDISFGQASGDRTAAFDAANKLAESCPLPLAQYVAESLATQVIAKKDVPPKTVECARKNLVGLLLTTGLAPQALKQNNEFGSATAAALSGMIVGAVREC